MTPSTETHKKRAGPTQQGDQTMIWDNTQTSNDDINSMTASAEACLAMGMKYCIGHGVAQNNVAAQLADFGSQDAAGGARTSVCIEDKHRRLFGVPIAQQRIFHLGRELKTLGRSLESLGVGRMGITVLHVHAVPSTKSSTEVLPANTVPPRRRQQKASTSLRPPNAVCINPASASEVVDLAGDDVDEDNDDGVVVLDEIAPSRSQRRRQRRRVG